MKLSEIQITFDISNQNQCDDHILLSEIKAIYLTYCSNYHYSNTFDNTIYI